jgi:hypothetical protein
MRVGDWAGVKRAPAHELPVVDDDVTPSKGKINHTSIPKRSLLVAVPAT